LLSSQTITTVSKTNVLIYSSLFDGIDFILDKIIIVIVVSIAAGNEHITINRLRNKYKVARLPPMMAMHDKYFYVNRTLITTYEKSISNIFTLRRERKKRGASINLIISVI